MKKIFALLCLVCARAWSCDGVEVADGWVREAPPGAETLAGYATFSNHARKARTLGAIHSPDFEAVEMHETRMSDGQMQMRALDGLRLATGESVAFAAGGKHLMLMQPRRPLKAGDTVSLTIACGKQSPLKVTLPVKAAP